MKRERHIWLHTNFVKSGVSETFGHINKKINTSTKQYNMRNWKSSSKRLWAKININKVWVCMILMEKKRLLEFLKRKKGTWWLCSHLWMRQAINKFNVWTHVCSTRDDHQYDERYCGYIQLWDKGNKLHKPINVNLYW